MGIAMLGTGWVSSRVGAKRTLLLGLALIIVGAGLRRQPGHRRRHRRLPRPVGPRQRALHRDRPRDDRQRRLRLGEAGDHPLRGRSRCRHRDRPAARRLARRHLVALAVLRRRGPHGRRLHRDPDDPARRPRRPRTRPRSRRRCAPSATAACSPSASRPCSTTSASSRCSPSRPFPLAMGAHEIGFIFFGWGVLLAITSVFVAPMIQRRFGTLAGIVGALLGFAVILAAMAIWTDEQDRPRRRRHRLAGAFLGVNNTLITETVMKVSPVERGVASAAYSFVRFSGGAVAPWLAGNLGEKSIHLPFWVGSVAVVLAVLVLLTARRHHQRARRGARPRRRGRSPRAPRPRPSPSATPDRPDPLNRREATCRAASRRSRARASSRRLPSRFSRGGRRGRRHPAGGGPPRMS